MPFKANRDRRHRIPKQAVPGHQLGNVRCELNRPGFSGGSNS
jgi:hypothetical protein